MGYCAWQDHTQFFIKKEYINSIIQAIKALKGHETIQSKIYDSCFKYVSNRYLELNNLSDIFKEWNWQIDFDNDGNIDDIEFLGEKLGDEIFLFKAISPYVKEDSYIEMYGEEGDKWRYYFKNGKCYEQDAVITWPELVSDEEVN